MEINFVFLLHKVTQTKNISKNFAQNGKVSVVDKNKNII